MLVWLNGRFVDARTARVSALDRGMLHGDGVYDTWRTYGGRPFALAAHLRRMTAATRRLGLVPPGPRAVWEARTRVLLRRNGLTDAALRLTITRGDAGSGPVPSTRARPTVLFTARALPPDLAALQAHGVAATLLPFGRDAGPGWGELKLIGHASAVLGKMLARKRGTFEGLYVTPDGRVTEGTTANLFAVERGILVTPPADGSILRGVTRDLVLDLARRAGIRTREVALDVRRLRRADEVFLTASTIEILPVVRIDGTRVGVTGPGAVTRTLLGRYRAFVGRSVRRR